MTGLTYQLRTFSEVHHALNTSAEPLAGLRKALPALAALFQARQATIDLLPPGNNQPEPIEVLHPDAPPESGNGSRAFAVEPPNVLAIWAGGFSPVFRVSDHLSQRQFKQAGFIRDVLGNAGWMDQLGFAVQLPNAALGVTFHRDRIFDDDEAHLAMLMQRCVVERFGAKPELGEPEPFRNAWRIPLDDGCDALILPFVARELLDRFFARSEAGRPGVLPRELQYWIRGQHQRCRRLNGHDAGNRIAIDRPHGRLHLWLQTTTPPRQEFLCLSEELGRHDFYRLKALRLTEREIEVIFWITRGKSDADIAVILGVAHKTINKHVENVLLKLAVTNRTSAAVRVVEWLADPTLEPGQRW